MLDLPQTAELTQEQLENFDLQYRLICLIIVGRSPKQALEYLKPEYLVLQTKTVHWVENLFRRYQNEGLEALTVGPPDPKNTLA